MELLIQKLGREKHFHTTTMNDDDDDDDRSAAQEDLLLRLTAVGGRHGVALLQLGTRRVRAVPPAR